MDSFLTLVSVAAYGSLYCTFPSLCVGLCVKILHQTEDSLQAKLIDCSAAELFLVAGVSVFDLRKTQGSKAVRHAERSSHRLSDI